MWVSPVYLFSGVEDISRSAFEHISHALMGGPLSRELVSMGRGLRGGALLITGAKVTLALHVEYCSILFNVLNNWSPCIGNLRVFTGHECVICCSSQGSGKSSLSRALCHKANKELDAHVQVMDCKMLKGSQTHLLARFTLYYNFTLSWSYFVILHLY